MNYTIIVPFIIKLFSLVPKAKYFLIEIHQSNLYNKCEAHFNIYLINSRWFVHYTGFLVHTNQTKLMKKNCIAR